jgi:hypothetical protein
MGKPRKRKKAADSTKTTQEWEALPDEDVIKHIFGPEGQQVLKDEAVTNEERTKSDYRLP